MPGRRLFMACLAFGVLTLPACVVSSAPVPITSPEQAAKMQAETKSLLRAKVPPVTDTQPTPPRMEFAILPKVPGTVVNTKTDTQKSATPSQAQKTDPAAITPPNAVKPAGFEPGLLPPITMPPEPPLLAAMRAYTEGRPERAIEIIRTLDKPNQDFVLSLLPVLARGATADFTNDPATTGAIVDQLHATAGRLETRAALRIEKVTFCSEVAGFGRYNARPDANPYKPNEQAELYLELRNLGQQQTGDGYLSHVTATVEIRDAHGKLVEQIDPNDWRRRIPSVKFDKRIVTRSALHDFYVYYAFAAPATPGVYSITFQLSDSTGRRTVKSQPKEFRVAGP
jgi:hypothetical protein